MLLFSLRQNNNNFIDRLCYHLSHMINSKVSTLRQMINHTNNFLLNDQKILPSGGGVGGPHMGPDTHTKHVSRSEMSTRNFC